MNNSSNLLVYWQKIRDRATAAPASSETLQSLTAAEQADKKKTATEGLLWLNR